MEKMNFETADLATGNIDKIAALFPNVITERKDKNGELKKGINFELLKQMLAEDVVEGKEAYEFTWVGKKAAIREAHKPIRKTLRPCPSESVDWDTTQNLYIEGDNLEVLKLLQESYLGKVKMIYIDPPYNTGNDFIYEDDFKMSAEEYAEGTGEYDDEGNRLFKNTDTNGRFHSDWCSMMYSRLLVSRNLLSDDGAIFISIADHEQANLKKICDEVFGVMNFVGMFIWRKKSGGGQADAHFVTEHEYVIVYCKSAESYVWKDKETERPIAEFNQEDEKGRFKITKLAKWGNTARREDRPTMYFPITAPDGSEAYPIAPDGGEGRWRVGMPKIQTLQAAGLIFWKNTDDGWFPYEKEYYTGQAKIEKARSILYALAQTGDGSKELTNLFNKKDFFENPKPVQLLKFLIEHTPGSIVLDFFSGSSTTAQAVMQLNAEDGGNRRFILVQLPEDCDSKSEAYKAGYATICEIGKERIRRAGAKIKEEHPDWQGDTGFRVLKVDSTNMKNVYYSADKYSQEDLSDFATNIKEDRTDMDLLFQCLLEWGLPLSLPHSSEKIEGYSVHDYNNGDLIACFEKDIPEDVIRTIAGKKPLRAVFRDNGFEDDSSKINVEEIFKLLAPSTSIKVI